MKMTGHSFTDENMEKNDQLNLRISLDSHALSIIYNRPFIPCLANIF